MPFPRGRLIASACTRTRWSRQKHRRTQQWPDVCLILAALPPCNAFSNQIWAFGLPFAGCRPFRPRFLRFFPVATGGQHMPSCRHPDSQLLARLLTCDPPLELSSQSQVKNSVADAHAAHTRVFNCLYIRFQQSALVAPKYYIYCLEKSSSHT